MTDDRGLERARWRCRRGMLELDLVLERFIDRQYATLTPSERVALERLLDLSDPELLDYCNGAALPDDPELQALVRKIAQ